MQNGNSSYNAFDVVSYLNGSYIALQASTGQPPATAPAYWQLEMANVCNRWRRR